MTPAAVLERARRLATREETGPLAGRRYTAMVLRPHELAVVAGAANGAVSP